MSRSAIARDGSLLAVAGIAVGYEQTVALVFRSKDGMNLEPEGALPWNPLVLGTTQTSGGAVIFAWTETAGTLWVEGASR